MFALQNGNPDFFGGFEKGFDLGNKMIEGMANRRAGRAIAAGDEQAGMNEMLKVGNMAGVQTYQKNQQDMTIAGNTDRRADTYEGIAVDQNDRSQTTHDRTIKEEDRIEALAFLTDTTAMLDNIYKEAGPEGTIQAFDQIEPVLKMRGTPPEQIAAYREQLAANPEQFINMLRTKTDEENKRYLVGPGTQLTDGTGKTLASSPFAPKTVTLSPDQQAYLLDPGNTMTGGTGPQQLGGQPGAAPSAVTPQERFKKFHTEFLGPVEGGYTPTDGRSGAPANFGVNQAANPDIDVKTLTPEQAQEVLYERYYVRSGADKLAEPIASVHADTAINAGVETAQRMLEKSGGDPAKYMALRQQYYESLGQEENLPVWTERNRKLGEYISQFGAGGTQTAAPQLPLAAQGKDKPVDQYVPVTPEEKKALNIPEGVVAQRNTRTGKVETIYTPSKTSGKTGESIKLSVQDNSFLNKRRESLLAWQGMEGELNEFITLNKTTKTGEIYASEGISSVKGAFDKDFGRMRAITSKITPAMRQGLPGAASNFDVQMFQDATLNVKKKYETNEATYKAFKRHLARNEDYVEFLESFAKENGNLLGAQEIWNEYKNDYPILSPQATADNMQINPNYKGWREAIPGYGKSTAAEDEVYDVATGEWRSAGN